MSGKIAIAGGQPGARPDSGQSTGHAEVGDLIVAYLEQLGIDYVFGVPGGAIEPLYNALARSSRRGGPRPIVARHESGAAFMADGYARETGKVGVCCSTAGPGATNLITGVACAHENDIPLLVITGQPPLPTFGRHALQESSCTGINTLGMFRHCTRYNSLVSHAKQVEQKLIEALSHATRSPRGPVHLTVPLDVMRGPSDPPYPSYDLPALLKPRSMVDSDAMEQLIDEVCRSRRMVLLVGAWCSEAIGAILQFAALVGATIVTTPDGKGLVSPRHPLFRGVFGFAGHTCAEDELRGKDVDLVLAIGTSIGEWTSAAWSGLLLNDHMIHIDSSEEHLAQTPMARLHVRGRILSIFRQLIDRLGDSAPATEEPRSARVLRIVTGTPTDPDSMVASRAKFDSDAAPITPQRLMAELGRRFPATTRFLADSGNSVAWAIHYLHPNDRRLAERRMDAAGRGSAIGRRETRGGWLRVTMGFAPMGWAIGGAVGTAVANPDVPVVCITGDGSMLMNGQELSAAVAERLTVIFVVLNDSALGMVKHGQRLGGGEPIAYQLPTTDFAALARALGADGHTIRSPADFNAIDMAAVATRKGPTLFDVYIDADEMPPMNLRMRVLAAV